MRRQNERIIKERQRIKKKKPKFRAEESWRYKRVKENWRKARGIDSKMRRKVKGWPRSPSIGYRGPKDARYLHPSGFVEVRVYNADDLEDIDPKTHAIRIAHTVGAKKRIEISARAEEKGLRILNPLRREEVVEEEEGEEVEEAAEHEEGEKGEEGS
ncbi:MAG: 50S ribosomal protein L32e [Candidatus Bathyarchaeota archaeon]|nr:50S ribosomal protein L32e [Candidatus Bathyarchaeota archaeon]MDH5732832.1 50S ribosomal protein L32e [Candidatus Bathyarchaeota archaeon]